MIDLEEIYDKHKGIIYCGKNVFSNLKGKAKADYENFDFLHGIKMIESGLLQPNVIVTLDESLEDTVKMIEDNL